ncbi:serine/threonine-protein kinase [Streptomyces spongiae]|uniref:non-specific serine/threonine protein kinase n=1 Tax=Streptomyces spongiae TaxID=565072 RepID=A0A5N8XKJ5_9ACTN|nr:serine/threonine-protein kinase [Streptomyces spongiae]MPY59105.1 serine/threonine protein kinase [Streptomyces spongiae]
MNGGESDRRVVDGRFELESRLGGGGMGTVWRARDLLLHRYVAVKEVRPADPDLAEYDPGTARMLRERVLREARALARVEHPNVVTIHHIVDGGEGTYPWLVMELVEGGSLADRLARGPMTAAEAARVGRGVLDALRAAHTAGVEHRDVKPANVLLRTDGRPVLTDFGIAAIREATALTATGSIIGTADYMAPERVSGDPGGPAADLWSLGMMLYVAVEGHHPLRRGTTLATLAAVLHEDVPPPVRAGSLTPVLHRVLTRDPAARPDAETVDRMLAAAAETADDPEPTSYPLAPPQDAVPVPQPPTHVPSGPRTRASRRPRRIAVASVAASAVLTGGLIWWTGLPGDNGDNGDNGGDVQASTGKDQKTQQESPSPTGSTASPSTAASGTLLTPKNIRTVIAAFEKTSGTDRFVDFTIYPDHAQADMMVNGSQTRYISYTYRPDTGAEEGLLKDTLRDSNKPVTVKNFRWDAVPALFARADKELKVEDPTSRYLTMRQPNSIFDTPVGMKVYLSNEFGESGYLEADTQGKVEDVRPAEQ